MSTIVNRIRRFIKSEDGPTAVEYAVMVALIAVAIIASVQLLGNAVDTTFKNVEGEISTLGED